MEPHINSSDYSYSDEEWNDTFEYALYEEICVKEEVRRFRKSFLPAFYSIVFLVGLAGNSLVVAIYAYFKKLKSRTDAYIMNLAIADLLLLFTLPFWAANAAHGWVLGLALCKITSAMYTLTFSARMQLLACISMDRYNAIIKPQSQQRVTKKCSKTCSVVWMAAMLLCVPELMFNTIIELHGRSECLPVFPKSLGVMPKATIQILEITLCFVLPFLIMVICYSAIARALLKSPSIKKSHPLKVLAAVVSAFILTQLPYNIIKLCRAIDIIFHLITDCNISNTIDVAFQVTKSIALFHSCLNPILYFVMGASIKTYMVKIVKNYGYWQRQQSTATEEIPMGHEESAEQTSSFTI
ncbi:atypical chemokine receptor 4 [Heteronotia binoei]|uniref:atypical chemokine receptor 4 n=1 Tax=Heteronotia binoei TaxID=13085 RepID=UPI00292E420F|nr:atypical chemokine receptor 4 [Heteronotia binoei]XP_060104877.1 atypical chemokine receptor 4 [Heteronotia binoei]